MSHNTTDLAFEQSANRRRGHHLAFTTIGLVIRFNIVTRFSTFGPEPEIEVVGDELAGEF